MALRQNDWTLGAFCSRYCRAVAQHHTLEDDAIFPHLQSGDLQLVEPLARPGMFSGALRRRLLLTYNRMVVSKSPSHDDEKAADLLFGALADPTRRDIFRRAHGGRFSVSALAREYPISVAAVQKHVAVLERAELVRKHRVGRESIVCVETDALARAHAALDRLETVWRDRVERMDQILETDKGDS
jgi:DNA-binding transcriptional ArsR family regulator